MKHNIILMGDVEDRSQWQGVGRNYASQRFATRGSGKRKKKTKREKIKVMWPPFDVRSLVEAATAPDYKTLFFFLPPSRKH